MTDRHLKRQDQKYLENQKLGKLFSASDQNKKKKGVAVYVKEHLKPTMKLCMDDGKCVTVDILMGQKKIIIVNIYVPNNQQEQNLFLISCKTN